MNDYCCLCDEIKEVKRDRNGDLKVCNDCNENYPEHKEKK
tara:strand:- start:819 stop:938 length:120 start_codon:yes stop_codon:yes gene_type:complete